MILVKKHYIVKFIALLLALCLASPVTAYAAEQEEIMPRESLYLDLYNTYICDMGRGEMQIWFEVMGTGYMDEIGVLSIQVYESTNNVNWTWKETFLYEDTPGMLTHNDYHFVSHVTYHGIAGRYYKAYVCIWAGKDGKGDTRYKWSTMV